MMTNPDGSRYSMYSIAEIIEDRCSKTDYPYLSDVLGSDWGAHIYGWKSPEHFKQTALKIAERYYEWL